MDSAIPSDTLIEQNQISTTDNGIITQGDYTRIAQNQITNGVGRQSIGIRVGLPGGHVPVGTEILSNLVEGFATGISLLATDSFVAQNIVRMSRTAGVNVALNSNIIKENLVTETIGREDAGGLVISSVGNLVLRNRHRGNWPFDLIVGIPPETTW